MRVPPFDIGYLRFLMRRADVFNYNLGTSEQELQQRLSLAVDELNTSGYEPQVAITKRIKKELVFIPKRFEDKLYLRHLNTRLSRLYRPKHTNRDHIIKQIRELLAADVPLNIVRTDIRQFFRNIDFQHLIDRFRLDGMLSSSEVNALKLIATHAAKVQHRGVPWGLSISSTLAEIYARDFDAAMRRVEGVYYYERFVDDIIIFSSCSPTLIQERLKEQLKKMPRPLRMNGEKTVSIEEKLATAAITSFSYLGYSFAREQRPKSASQVKITIDVRKIDRLKNRIRASILQFNHDRDWNDLKARLKLLTGNYRIRRSAHQGRIKTGIYYNYSAITHYEQLSELDHFLRCELIGLRCSLRRKGRRGHMRLLRQLFRYSFLEGHKKKLVHRASRRQLERLLGAWRNEK